MIIVDRPPNFEVIKAAFPNAENAGVIFAYDGNIYSPDGPSIPPYLIAHESVHLAEQKVIGADMWWDAYIHDDEFRYSGELLAHAAEMRAFFQAPGDRNARAALLMRTALRLTAPLYNYTPPRSLQQALKDLQQEIAK
jgi:hypothetical protein